MNRAKAYANKVYDSFDGKGVESCKYLLEAEFKKAIEEERADILKNVIENEWTYQRIPFNMWVSSIWTLVFKPRHFFASYFKHIQIQLAKKIRNKDHNDEECRDCCAPVGEDANSALRS